MRWYLSMLACIMVMVVAMLGCRKSEPQKTTGKPTAETKVAEVNTPKVAPIDTPKEGNCPKRITTEAITRLSNTWKPGSPLIVVKCAEGIRSGRWEEINPKKIYCVSCNGQWNGKDGYVSTIVVIHQSGETSFMDWRSISRANGERGMTDEEHLRICESTWDIEWNSTCPYKRMGD